MSVLCCFAGVLSISGRGKTAERRRGLRPIRREMRPKHTKWNYILSNGTIAQIRARIDLGAEPRLRSSAHDNRGVSQCSRHDHDTVVD